MVVVVVVVVVAMQEAVRGSVLDAPPPVLLGRRAQWYDFASGFGWELGRDEDRDVRDVPLLLMRLARRATHPSREEVEAELAQKRAQRAKMGFELSATSWYLRGP